jgi:hypothetical protein
VTWGSATSVLASASMLASASVGRGPFSVRLLQLVAFLGNNVPHMLPGSKNCTEKGCPASARAIFGIACIARAQAGTGSTQPR